MFFRKDVKTTSKSTVPTSHKKKKSGVAPFCRKFIGNGEMKKKKEGNQRTAAHIRNKIKRTSKTCSFFLSLVAKENKMVNANKQHHNYRG